MINKNACIEIWKEFLKNWNSIIPKEKENKKREMKMACTIRVRDNNWSMKLMNTQSCMVVHVWTIIVEVWPKGWLSNVSWSIVFLLRCRTWDHNYGACNVHKCCKSCRNSWSPKILRSCQNWWQKRYNYNAQKDIPIIHTSRVWWGNNVHRARKSWTNITKSNIKKNAKGFRKKMPKCNKNCSRNPKENILTIMELTIIKEINRVLQDWDFLSKINLPKILHRWSWEWKNKPSKKQRNTCKKHINPRSKLPWNTSRYLKSTNCCCCPIKLSKQNCWASQSSKSGKCFVVWR